MKFWPGNETYRLKVRIAFFLDKLETIRAKRGKYLRCSTQHTLMFCSTTRKYNIHFARRHLPIRLCISEGLEDGIRCKKLIVDALDLGALARHRRDVLHDQLGSLKTYVRVSKMKSSVNMRRRENSCVVQYTNLQKYAHNKLLRSAVSLANI